MGSLKVKICYWRSGCEDNADSAEDHESQIHHAADENYESNLPVAINDLLSSLLGLKARYFGFFHSFHIFYLTAIALIMNTSHIRAITRNEHRALGNAVSRLAPHRFWKGPALGNQPIFVLRQGTGGSVIHWNPVDDSRSFYPDLDHLKAPSNTQICTLQEKAYTPFKVPRLRHEHQQTPSIT